MTTKTTFPAEAGLEGKQDLRPGQIAQAAAEHKRLGGWQRKLQKYRSDLDYLLVAVEALLAGTADEQDKRFILRETQKIRTKLTLRGATNNG